MNIDKTKITTQDDLGEPAPMDEADKRAEKEMKKLERGLSEMLLKDWGQRILRGTVSPKRANDLPA